MVILTEKNYSSGEWLNRGSLRESGGVKVPPLIGALEKIYSSASNTIIDSDTFADYLGGAILEARRLYWLLGPTQSKAIFRLAQPDLNRIWDRIRVCPDLRKMPPFTWKECRYEFPRGGDRSQVSVRSPSRQELTGWVKVSENFSSWLVDEGVISPYRA